MSFSISGTRVPVHSVAIAADVQFPQLARILRLKSSLSKGWMGGVSSIKLNYVVRQASLHRSNAFRLSPRAYSYYYYSKSTLRQGLQRTFDYAAECRK